MEEHLLTFLTQHRLSLWIGLLKVTAEILIMFMTFHNSPSPLHCLNHGMSTFFPAVVPKGIGDPCLWSQLKTLNRKLTRLVVCYRLALTTEVCVNSVTNILPIWLQNWKRDLTMNGWLILHLHLGFKLFLMTRIEQDVLYVAKHLTFAIWDVRQ